MMIVAMGEILFDNFPGYRRIGGAPFNFAYHMRGLGFDARFASRIGDDENGKKILSFLREKGFGTELIQTDPSHPTGEVNISLDSRGVADFTILPDAAYDYIEADKAMVEDLRKSSLVYFGTLVQRGPGFETIQRLLSIMEGMAHTIYDVNLRRDCYSETVIRSSLEKSDIVKLNHEELVVLSEMFRFHGEERDFANYLMEQYSISMVSVTKGEQGSALYTRDGCAEAGPAADIDLVDTVGAGDGYTAVLAAGYMRELDIQVIVDTAAEFAARICGIEGALPGKAEFYDPFRDIFHGGVS